MTQLKEFLDKYLNVSFADIRVTDILEMVIIAFLLYEIMLWIKKTRVWVLLKGFYGIDKGEYGKINKIVKFSLLNYVNIKGRNSDGTI